MAGKFRVTADALNLRAGPGVDNAILAVLFEGTTITGTRAVLVKTGSATWINVVTVDRLDGWVNDEFIAEIDIVSPATFKVTAGALNLRALPDPESAILLVLQNGDVVTDAGGEPVTLPGDNVWFNVFSADGTNGFVNSKFLATVGGAEPIVVDGALAWGAHVSPEFREKVRVICKNLGFEPDFLMAAMAFETGREFKSNTPAGVGPAIGLIQFLPSTAIGLGTTSDELAAMNEVRQLDFVEKHFLPFKGRIKTIEDVYMAIFRPIAVGKPNDEVLLREGSEGYKANKPLDVNRDGIITKREAAGFVIKALAEGLLPANRG